MTVSDMGPAAPLAHINLIRARVSEPRFSRYLEDCEGDDVAALRLYEWNIAIGGAFHETLGQLEVVVRNGLDAQLRRWHRKALNGNGRWFDDHAVPLQDESRRQIRQAIRHATRAGGPPTHGKVVAELTFGFWRFLLDAYHQPTLWAPALRHAFPHLRPRIRQNVYDPMSRLNNLRNRIAHHEPLYRHDLEARLHDVLTVAGFVCPTVAAWIWSSTRVPATLVARPVT